MSFFRNIGQVFTDTAGKIYRVFIEAKVIVEEGIDKIKGNPPEITSFTSSVDYVVDEEPLIIKWNVAHAPSVFLNGELVEKRGEMPFLLNNDQTFTLEARNDDLINKETGQPLSVSQQLVVRVDKSPPAIIFFNANKQQVSDGESIVLNWEVERATTILIDGIGHVTGNTFTVTPTHDITYTLRAYSFTGRESEASFQITVDKTPPAINYFEADRYFLEDKNPLILKWSVDNATKVELVRIGEFSMKDSVEVFPREDTQFLLRATSFYGIVETREISVQVSKEPPVIHSFYADKYVLNDESPATLEWVVENAETIVIDNDVGDVSHLHEIQTHNMDDAIYTLTATSYFGIPVSASLEIKINKEPPEIALFSADKEFILADFEACLVWETQRAYTVDILPGIGRVSAMGSQTVLIRKDSHFTLVATSYFGFQSQKEISIRILPLPLMEQLLIPGVQIDASVQLEYAPIQTSQLSISDIIATPISFIEFNDSLLQLPEFDIKIDMSLPKQAKLDNLIDAITDKVKKEQNTHLKNQDNESD